jgi:hypothetical protein
VSSTAHTLLSTTPSGRATSRIVSSVMSVATPDDRFGQAIHSPPSGNTVAAKASMRRSRSARRVKKATTTSALRLLLARRRTSTPSGSGARSASSVPGAPTSRSAEPSFTPSFFANGVPE